MVKNRTSVWFSFQANNTTVTEILFDVIEAFIANQDINMILSTECEVHTP